MSRPPPGGVDSCNSRELSVLGYRAQSLAELRARDDQVEGESDRDRRRDDLQVERREQEWAEMSGRSWIKRIGDVRGAEEDDEGVLDHERHPERCDENDGRSSTAPDERADPSRLHKQRRASSG